MDIIIGMISTLIAFGAKYVADYMWLKSPRVNIHPQPVHFTKNPYRSDNVVIASCRMIINNHSKNDIYSFKVDLITFSDQTIRVLPESINRIGTPITDILPGEIKFTCEKPSSSGKEASMITKEEKSLSSVATVCCSYKNQLGKLYKKRINIYFNEQDPGFFTFSI